MVNSDKQSKPRVLGILQRTDENQGPDTKGKPESGTSSRARGQSTGCWEQEACRVPGWAGVPEEGAAQERDSLGFWQAHGATPSARLRTLPASLKHRARREQPGLAGVRVPDPQAHPAALRVPAGGAPADHPLRAQRHRENLPGQPATWTTSPAR